ncbi:MULTISPECIES: P-loop NTPase fold protein [Trichocoleus]|uniref:KAP family NTPase n=1 Tax=Trichocoleus desertorum GB2-A4 TaxID=2933944 RepID=A0ABV0J9E5_9CYAN|nr:P-loop NTPase fold protein [Trichocoleus sp. FACHB-46]MBD1864769.1 hypothetical protein [Trichocoleus sp. FACHB-46]
MSSKELESAIINYLKDRETEYAIMINGEWGCGKTYFWQSRIVPHLEKLKKRVVYVSLYGLKSTAEIGNLLLLELIPYLKNQKDSFKGLKSSLEAASSLLKIDSKIKDFILEITKYKLLDSLDNSVLCFDDLERVDFDIKAVLGHINRFVEHRRIKTVLICYEAEVNQLDYKRTKEKLVGYTFEFSSSLEETIEHFIKEYDDNLKTKIIYHKNFIVDVLTSEKIKNLRIIKNSLSIAKTVLASFFDIDESATDVEREILRFVFAINIEFKAGRLDLAQINAWIEKGYDITFVARKKEEDTESYLSRFIRRYYGVNSSYQVTFRSIYNYIVGGYFDQKLFSEEILSLRKTEKTSKYNLINNYTLLSDSDFFNTSKEYIEDLKQDRINKPTELINLCKSLMFFSEVGLIEERDEELKNIFNHTIQRQFLEGKLEYQDIANDSRLSHNEPKSKFYAEIKELILNISKQQHEVILYKEANVLVSLLKEKPEEFFREVYKYNTEANTPLFKYINTHELFDAIIQLKNLEIVDFRGCIISRYKAINISRFLADDYQGLKNLSHMLKSFIANQKAGSNRIDLSCYLINMLCEEIDAACDRLISFAD